MNRNIKLTYLDVGRLYVNITPVLSLIEYHYSHNEDKFKEYCQSFIEELYLFNEDELARHIQAQMSNNSRFVPMKEEHFNEENNISARKEMEKSKVERKDNYYSYYKEEENA